MKLGFELLILRVDYQCRSLSSFLLASLPPREEEMRGCFEWTFSVLRIRPVPLVSLINCIEQQWLEIQAKIYLPNRGSKGGGTTSEW